MSCALFLTTVSFVRCLNITSTDLLVGHSIELTVLQMIGSALFWLEVVLYTFSWLVVENRIALIGGNYEGTLREIAQFRRLVVCGGFFGVLASLTSAVMIVEDDFTDANLLTLVLSFLNSIAASFIAFAFASCARTIQKVLQASFTSQDSGLEHQIGTDNILRKINVLLVTVTIVATTNATFWQMFGWWPWLRTRIGYYVAPSWTSILILLIVGMAVTNPIAEWKSLGGGKQLGPVRPSISHTHTPSHRPSVQSEYRPLGGS